MPVLPEREEKLTFFLLCMTGLREEVVVCEEDVMEFVAKGSQSRRTGATAMNDKSSRSHAVFRITIESKDEHECIIMAQLVCIV